MNGGSLLIRSGSNLCLQQQNGLSQTQATRRPPKVVLSNVRERERILPFICRRLSRSGVAMLLLVALALLVFLSGFFSVQKEIQQSRNYDIQGISVISSTSRLEDKLDNYSSDRGGENSTHNISLVYKSGSAKGDVHEWHHPCDKFAFPPPPPADRRRPGPRPCLVCYVPAEQARVSMPSSPSVPLVLHNLTYVHDENPIKSEPYGGSDFGGYPSLKDRSDSYDIKESMTVHCGFVKGKKPGQRSGFDIDEADIMELEQYHDVIVASAIFGNYDVIQQPEKITEETKRRVPFFMFVDEETEMHMKNSSKLNGEKRVGLWRIVVVHNIPYADPRRNGKIPKLLLHRIFPNVRYSIWIDGKLQLVVDPYQILERFLWRENASFAISKHYKRFDVFEEAEANKAAGKYDNSSIDEQIQFYENYDGLTHYSEAKLPVTSDVPEGCVLIREHIPITNLFTCLWFNEVDRFTSRDQLSFSTVRDKIASKVGWSINMFLDCERRNFVIQAYHRELLEQMPPPAPAKIHRTSIDHSTHGRKHTNKHSRKGDKKSKRHRKSIDFFW